jgi:hypothetical protein
MICNDDKGDEYLLMMEGNTKHHVSGIYIIYIMSDNLNISELCYGGWTKEGKKYMGC